MFSILSLTNINFHSQQPQVKTLVNKPGAAMIQYTDKMSTDISIRNLNNLTLFGQKFQLS